VAVAGPTPVLSRHPPHCPNPNCSAHNAGAEWHYAKRGTYLHDLLRDLQLQEPLVADGLEASEYSQYFPFYANLAVGPDSGSSDPSTRMRT
jgi:hypothetical protein